MGQHRTRKGRAVNGWLLLDKPAGLLSSKAVAVCKALFGARKVGHAGTLDPLATGILPIAFGEATKTVPYMMADTKTYQFTVSWGAETETDDSEGDVTQRSAKRPTREQIAALLPEFTGPIQQVPPFYSAIKLMGKRAYALARDQRDFELAAREVHIERLELLEAAAPDTDTSGNAPTGSAGLSQTRFRARCGKGTYIRALARDMGRRLGCYGHITALRRTQIGRFVEGDTILLDKLKELRHSAPDPTALDACLHDIGLALDDIPAFTIQADQAGRLRLGQALPVRALGTSPQHPTAATNTSDCQAVCNGELVALGRIDQGLFKPFRVFQPG